MKIKGRIPGFRKNEFVSSYHIVDDVLTVRIDSEENDEFWMEITIPLKENYDFSFTIPMPIKLIEVSTVQEKINSYIVKDVNGIELPTEMIRTLDVTGKGLLLLKVKVRSNHPLNEEWEGTDFREIVSASVNGVELSSELREKLDDIYNELIYKMEVENAQSAASARECEGTDEAPEVGGI